MSGQHYLIIGAGGFIGAWICKLLVEQGARVTATDATPDPRSAESVLTDAHRAKIKFVTSDARNAAETDQLVGDDVTHVIYMAGLLRPASEINPWLSAEVSIGGLIHVFNAAIRRKGDLKIAYASTAAVYGPDSATADKRIVTEARPNPTDHYGIHRFAMELTARAFFQQHGVVSLGLRPWIVYGAGRFNGLSAQPSIAMLAAAADQPFEMAFGGRHVLHHVREVAAAFILGVQSNLTSAVCANIPGESVEMGELVNLIGQLAPNSRGKITVRGSGDLKQAEIVDDPTLEQLIGPLKSPTEERVRETIEDYRRLLSEGRISFP